MLLHSSLFVIAVCRSYVTPSSESQKTQAPAINTSPSEENATSATRHDQVHTGTSEFRSSVYLIALALPIRLSLGHLEPSGKDSAFQVVYAV